MIKYMFINVNWEKIKYQIGNRYKSIKANFKMRFKSWKEKRFRKIKK